MADPIERLVTRLEGSKSWPPANERAARRELRLFRALRETDRDHIKAHLDWDSDRSYVVDPLPERIPGCWADMIFGEAPTFTPAAEADKDALDALLQANAVADNLQEAVKIASSEKEAWWRIVVDHALSHPLIEWRSPISTYSLSAGHQTLAVAFVDRLQAPGDEDDDNAVWRFVEYQERGRIVQRLYRATSGGAEEADTPDRGLGAPRELADHPETADLEEEWNHSLDVMLAGCVRNGRGARPTAGRSDYVGPLDLLLQLNETTTVGSENMRLSGKKRAVVTPDMLDENGQFPSGTDVFVANQTDGDPDDKAGNLVQVEWQFEAAPLIAWKEDLADTALTRARIAPQLIGRFTEGAQTGPALRARLLDSILCAEGKARAWETEVPNALCAAQLVDALPEEQGGFGHQWSSSGEAPGMDRKDSLPVDATEETQRLASELSAELISRRTAIAERHPEWDGDRIEEELKFIDEDTRPVGPPFGD